MYSGKNKNTDKTDQSADVKSETEDYSNTFKSLTGETQNYFDFKHNNMKPFFGSNVTQTTDSNSRVFSSLFNEIIIVDPALYLPCKSSSERGSSSNLCIDLLKGLAPNSLS